MSGFQVGEIVDITVKGARVMAPKPGIDDVLTLAYEEVQPGVFATLELRRPRAGSVTIERSAPAEWPPVPGDMWQTIEDTELSAPTYWAAVNVDHLADGMGVRLICASYHEDGSWLTTPEDLLKQGRLTLIAPSPLRNTNGGGDR